MKDDLSAKLGAMLKGIDGDTIKKFIDSGGAEKLNKMFSEEEKNRLAAEFMKTDSDDLKKKLQGVDLKNIDIDSIMKKMK